MMTDFYYFWAHYPFKYLHSAHVLSYQEHHMKDLNIKHNKSDNIISS